MLEAPTQYANTAKRLQELAEMMRRTALDVRATREERVEELTRLHHRARQRLDECANLAEATAEDRAAA